MILNTTFKVKEVHQKSHFCKILCKFFLSLKGKQVSMERVHKGVLRHLRGKDNVSDEPYKPKTDKIDKI